MSHGYRRTNYQILPESKARICCTVHDDPDFGSADWFASSISGWPQHNALVDTYLHLLDRGDRAAMRDWDFVLVVPWISVRDFWSANDGMQAWRHKRTGYVVPDHCRQTGGCPEVWNSSNLKGQKELKILNLEEIEEYVVLEHGKVSR